MKKLIAFFLFFFISTAYSLTVDLSATPTVVDVGQQVTFTAVITKNAGTETQPYNFTFDFGDTFGTGTDVITNETDDTITIEYTYTTTDADNEFTAQVDVSDSTGLTASDTIDIEVYNLQVSLITVPDPATGDIDFLVDFTATATDGASPYVFEWNWGDGQIETVNSAGTSNLTHEYTTQDTFTAKVTVTDRRLKSVEQTVTVVATVGGNAAPIAEANGPYQNHIGVSFELDSTGSNDSGGSGGGAGGITNYTWVLEIQAGNPQCTFDFTGTDTISGNGMPYRKPDVTCNDIGTAKVTLTVRDGPGATDSDTATIKINPTQTKDKVNIVKMWVEPEVVKEGIDLKVWVTVRNETSDAQTFDLNYQIKENISDANISALPNLIPNLELLSQSVDGYKQKDFEITIPAASISSNLDPQKNYWVYATATVAGENNILMNTRRAVFNYNAFKKVQIPETNFIGVLTVLLISLMILKNKKR